MEFRKLGNTNLKVSTICLGTMTWGEQNSQKEAFEQMDYALDKGVNFFDTAELYSVPPKKETYGKTEEIIGSWLKEKKKRNKIILATKISGPGLSWIRKGGLQYTEKSIENAINDSLKRLKTDFIDLYQLHWPERKTNYFGALGYEHDSKEEKWNDFKNILEILSKFIEKGKIRYIGLSNETAWGLSKFLEISKIFKLPKMMSVQNPYNLLNRSYEVSLAEMSIREESGLLAYSPLAFGFLTGKYRNNNLPEGTRMKLFGKSFARYKSINSTRAIEEYYKIAKKNDLSLTQMSLAFVNSRPFLTSNIIGATNMDQLKEDIDSINIKLSKEIIEEINSIHKYNPNPAP
tara:strand:- start:66 stop:1106 length:1041 start_codon:yes stop_codon:yes gene_type:complete